MTKQDATKQKSLIPWMIVGFFVVLAMVDGFFVYKALSTHTGVRVENSYEKGLAYNKTLANFEEQKQRGWQAQVDVAPLGARKATLTFTLRDKEKKMIEGADVNVKFVRPTREDFDNEMQLEETGAGIYQLTTQFPLVGVWDVFISAQKDATPFNMKKRIIIPDEEKDGGKIL